MTTSLDSSASQTSRERPSHHVVHPLTGTLSFKNPWPSASAPTASELLFGGAWLGWPKLHLHHHPKARELQVIEPTWGKEKVKELKKEAEKQGKGDKVQFTRGTWLGHASVFVELPVDVPKDPSAAAAARRRRVEAGEKAGEGEEEEEEDEQVTLKMLFDPIFSERAGPTSYTGPGRIRPPPCKVEDLPGVDAVFVSHNHYDHLDAGTVKSIMDNWPRAKYFVPLGNKQWLYATGVLPSQIFELDWWEEVDLAPSDFGLAPAPLPSPPELFEDPSAGREGRSNGRTSRARSYSFRDDPITRELERIRITCVPAQHNSGVLRLPESDALPPAVRHTLMRRLLTRPIRPLVRLFQPTHSSRSSPPCCGKPTGRSPTDQASTLWAGWVVERLVESDKPDARPKFGYKSGLASNSASTESFVSAREDAPQQVISETVVEEPEEEAARPAVEDEDESAVAEDADTTDDEGSGPGPGPSHLHLTPPSDGDVRGVSPASSSVSLATDEGESATPSPPSSSAHQPLSVPPKPRRRRSSVRDVLERSSSFSKSLGRRLSVSSGSKSRSPGRSPSFSQPTAPSPLSRSSSLRQARESDKEREQALSDAMGDVHINESSDGLQLPPGAKEALSMGELPHTPPPQAKGFPAGPGLLQEKREQQAQGAWGGGKRLTRKGAIYFAGDTGYRRHRKAPEPVCPAFDELGRKYGPFDLSFVPIWRGGTLGFVSAMGLRLHHENISSALHGSPADAVDIHLDVRSRNTIGVHFGTFIGSESEALEAMIELHEACEEAGVKNLDDPEEDELGRMGVVDIGETWCCEIQELMIVS